MKVSQMKLDSTMIEFYNNDIEELNYKCFELMIYGFLCNCIHPNEKVK